MRAPRFWSHRGPLAWTLSPLGGLFRLLAAARRGAYRRGWCAPRRLSRPVVVVGNIDVGGSGKTPLVTALVALCRRQGWSPGIVSRGYRGKARYWPQHVDPDSDPALVGDEPVLLARRCRVPLVAAPDRVLAARTLLDAHSCDLIIADDGLQHYRLHRDLEICVIDAERGLGNGFCLPAGPLREPAARLAAVDFVFFKTRQDAGETTVALSGRPLWLEATQARLLADPQRRAPLARWRGRRVHAVAGIGRPESFFELLRAHGLKPIPHPFPDHHAFRPGDLRFGDGLPIFLTEKDAVKWRIPCVGDAVGDAVEIWYVPLDARLEATDESELLSRLQALLAPAAARAEIRSRGPDKTLE